MGVSFFSPQSLVVLGVAIAITIVLCVLTIVMLNRSKRVLATVTILVAVMFGSSAAGLQLNRHLDYFTTWHGLAALFHLTSAPSAEPDPITVNPYTSANQDVRIAVAPSPKFAMNFQWSSWGQEARVTGPKSGITRPMWVWTPRGYDPSSPEKYSVMVILQGYPGNPQKVLHQLHIAQRLQKRIDEGTMKPTIVVVPSLEVDQNEPDCVDVANRPKVGTWITDDMVTVLLSTFPNISHSREDWTIAGASAGGYCAGVTALAHPDIYGNGIILAGYDDPQLGLLKNSPVQVRNEFTITKMIDGDRPAAARQYPQRLFFAAAGNDRAAVRLLHEAKERARPPLTIATDSAVKGGHNWHIFSLMFPAALDWLVTK